MNKDLIICIVAVFLLWQFHEHIVYIIITILLFLILCQVIRLSNWLHRRHVNKSMKSVDVMTGLEFEKFIAGILRENGYTRVRLTNTYDYGVDILAWKDGVQWGIQVKRNEGQTKASAARQVITGLKVYGCDRAMVITNSHFGRYAVVLAIANDCVLIDRTSLYRLISKSMN